MILANRKRVEKRRPPLHTRQAAGVVIDVIDSLIGKLLQIVVVKLIGKAFTNFPVMQILKDQKQEMRVCKVEIERSSCRFQGTQCPEFGVTSSRSRGPDGTEARLFE